jgi:hypothetical protein
MGKLVVQTYAAIVCDRNEAGDLPNMGIVPF